MSITILSLISSTLIGLKKLIFIPNSVLSLNLMVRDKIKLYIRVLLLIVGQVYLNSNCVLVKFAQGNVNQFTNRIFVQLFYFIEFQMNFH